MTLNILGAKVRVIKVKDLEHRGEADFPNNLIKIRDDLTGSEFRQTLWHEVSHWILFRSGLNEGLDSVLIEAICDVHGFALSENNLLPLLKCKSAADLKTR